MATYSNPLYEHNGAKLPIQAKANLLSLTAGRLVAIWPDPNTNITQTLFQVLKVKIRCKLLQRCIDKLYYLLCIFNIHCLNRSMHVAQSQRN
ncbi:hypothetical protein BH09BAC1_BH09BAC1_11810 [soil metagenome]